MIARYLSILAGLFLLSLTGCQQSDGPAYTIDISIDAALASDREVALSTIAGRLQQLGAGKIDMEALSRGHILVRLQGDTIAPEDLQALIEQDGQGSFLIPEADDMRDEFLRDNGALAELLINEGCCCWKSAAGKAKLQELWAQHARLRGIRDTTIHWLHNDRHYGGACDEMVVYDQDREAIPLHGDVLKDVRADLDPTGHYAVMASFSPEYSRAWERMTRGSIGRRIAIVIDEQVISAPMVQSTIAGGNMQITGGFNWQEARLMAAKLGTTPFPQGVRVEAKVRYTTQ